MKLTEFYAEKQGRPDSKVTLDMESRKPVIPFGLISGVMLTASHSTVARANDYTAAGYTVILVDTRSSPVTITLPSASASAGKFYYIKKVDISRGVVEVQGDAFTETIDGAVSVEMGLQYQYVMVLCDGTVWHILGGMNMKLEEILSSLLNEQIALLEQLRTEIAQVKLHLASGSDEPVDEESVRED